MERGKTRNRRMMKRRMEKMRLNLTANWLSILLPSEDKVRLRKPWRKTLTIKLLGSVIGFKPTFQEDL